MTQATRSIVAGLCLGLTLLAPAGLSADDPKPPVAPAAPELPAGVVARIYGADGTIKAELTFDRLGMALVDHVMNDLGEISSAALTILRELVEELIVTQELARLKLTVTEDEVRTYVGKLDTQLRTASGGQQNIAAVRKAKGMTWERFRDSIHYLLAKEKVAGHAAWLGKLPENDRQRLSQVSVVVTELHKRAKLLWHVPVAPQILQQAHQAEPVAGPPEALVTVNGTPITKAEFGKALVERLPEDTLKDVVDKECATKLLQLESVALDDVTMDEELAVRERNWAVQRTLMSQTEWHNVGFEEFLKATLKKTRAELRADRYYRSYYGLVRRERTKVTEAMLLQEWEVKKNTQYGPAILVEQLQVGFERKNALLTGGVGRDRAQALAVAQGVLTQVARGLSFTEAIKEAVARGANPRTGMPDPTLRSSERRLYNTQADQILFQEANKLRDGEVSAAPIETLSEVHLLRRKGSEPGPTFGAVKEILREMLAGQEAQYFMQKQAKDPTRVQVRWPIRVP